MLVHGVNLIKLTERTRREIPKRKWKGSTEVLRCKLVY